MNEQKTVTLKEARFAIGCGEKFLRAEITRGAIAVRRVNARVILVYLNSLNGYIESRRTTTAEVAASRAPATRSRNLNKQKETNE